MPFKTKLFRVAACLSFAIVLYIQMREGYAGDKQWILLAARMWLQGRKLYEDIIEVNPPLILWLNAIPVYISQHIPWLKDYTALAGIGGASIALSVFVSLRLMRAHDAFSGNAAKQWQWGLVIASVLLISISPAFFFDREHIFLVLTFPYMIRWMPSLATKRFSIPLRLALAVMAAIGFCIKPYCFLVFAAIQAMFILRERSWAILASMENCIIYLVAACYLSAVVQLYPAYIHIIIPMALATYSAIFKKMDVLRNFAFALLFFSIPMADFRLRYTSPYRRDIYYLLGLCASCLLYDLVNNWWSYTFVPLNSMILILTAFLGWEYLYLRETYSARGEPVRQFIFGFRACMITVALSASLAAAVFYLILTQSNIPYFERSEAGRQYLQDVKAAGSFGTLSGDFSWWARLSAETDAKWQTRFNNPWMLPKFFASGDAFRQKNHWIIDYVSNGLADDMNRNKPQLMFVDDIYVDKNTDLLAYFNAFPAFRAAWSHYHYLHSINDCPPFTQGVAVTFDRRQALQHKCSRDVYRRD